MSPDLHGEGPMTPARVTCSARTRSGAACNSPGAGKVRLWKGLPEGRQWVAAATLLPL